MKQYICVLFASGGWEEDLVLGAGTNLGSAGP